MSECSAFSKHIRLIKLSVTIFIVTFLSESIILAICLFIFTREALNVAFWLPSSMTKGKRYAKNVHFHQIWRILKLNLFLKKASRNSCLTFHDSLVTLNCLKRLSYITEIASIPSTLSSVSMLKLGLRLSPKRKNFERISLLLLSLLGRIIHTSMNYMLRRTRHHSPLNILIIRKS